MEDTRQSTRPLLEVQDLKTHFPVRRGILQRVVDHVRAVDGVSFKIQPGETLGLVGESGCGKTTVGRTILRLIPATSGAVRYEGENVFEALMETVKWCSLGQISDTLFSVGGQYRRNM